MRPGATAGRSWNGRAVPNAGFAALSVSDRLVWTTPEPLTAPAAAVGATSRIRLLTSVLPAPLRADRARFAEAVTTLDRLAGAGRLQPVLAPGPHENDFAVGGVDYASREVLCRRRPGAAPQTRCIAAAVDRRGVDVSRDGRSTVDIWRSWRGRPSSAPSGSRPACARPHRRRCRGRRVCRSRRRRTTGRCPRLRPRRCRAAR
ncbi:LLM class flavin-dependent oxidoreductase [Thermomonospora catenispora]|nr:LLM class flavin-dependent oxidoreductase [Thermomonospora catenispora]